MRYALTDLRLFLEIAKARSLSQFLLKDPRAAATRQSNAAHRVGQNKLSTLSGRQKNK